MEALQARILIKHVKGAIIAYLYNRESFDLLRIEKQPNNNSQFIEINQIIEFDGEKYKVDHINFMMQEKLYDMNHGLGTNLYSPTDASDFNCQIGIFVVSIE